MKKRTRFLSGPIMAMALVVFMLAFTGPFLIEPDPEPEEEVTYFQEVVTEVSVVDTIVPEPVVIEQPQKRTGRTFEQLSVGDMYITAPRDYGTNWLLKKTSYNKAIYVYRKVYKQVDQYDVTIEVIKIQ